MVVGLLCAHRGTALTLRAQHRLGHAAHVKQDTVEKQPRSALAHGNLALSCMTIGDRACALRELKIAVELNPYRDDFRAALDEVERSPALR